MVRAALLGWSLLASCAGQDLFLSKRLPETSDQPISKVYVLFSNHLDVGYTDYAMSAPPRSSFQAKSGEQCESGSIWVGYVDKVNVWIQHVSFQSAMASTPAVRVAILGGSAGGVITPDQPCCGDSFDVQAANLTQQGFDYRIERLNPSKEGGWGQELLLGWSTDVDACPFPALPPSPPYGGVPVLLKNWYDFVPRAASTAFRLPLLEGAKPEWEYKWMGHSWVFDMFLGCQDAPDGPELNATILKCPTPEQVADFEAAVRSGAVTWHAFPHNAEPEMYTADFFLASLNRTFELDRRFGRSTRRALSQRDVPGLSRAAIPLLREAGVELVAIGANGAAGHGGVADVPRVFRWEDRATGQDVITLLHQGGYGSFDSIHDCAIVHEAGTAICPAWRSDNTGPHSAEEALEIFQKVQAAFPNATVRSSDAYEEFLDAVKPVKDLLPTITQELGDSWIHGVSTDPVKVATYRAALRARKLCQSEGRWDFNGRAENAFDRLVVKVGEHTWGDNSHECREAPWNNTALHRTLEDGTWQGQKCIATWKEQRNYILNAVMELKLWDGACAEDVARAVREASPPSSPFDVSRYTKLDDMFQTFALGDLSLAFGPTGGMVKLSKDGYDWASPESPLAEFVYQTLDGSTMQDFIHNYSKDVGCCSDDFYKPGLPDSLDGGSTAGIARGQLQELWHRSELGSMSFVAVIVMPSFEHEFRGAPEKVLLKADVSEGSLALTLQLRNKTITHIPETPWLAFPARAEAVEAHKMGSWLDPTDVPLSFGFWAPHLHALDLGFRFASGHRSLAVQTLDAALASFGVMNPTPYHHAVPKASDGVYVSLVNNIWNTNYPQWFPFSGEFQADSNLQYRFVLSL